MANKNSLRLPAFMGSGRPDDVVYASSERLKVPRLNVKPVRKGKRYCSQACGAGCTYADYQRAVAGSKALLAKLKGQDWKARIWEKLGWQYAAVSGPVQVYVHVSKRGNVTYTAMIAGNLEGWAGGYQNWTPDEIIKQKDPNKAVTVALKHACRHIASKIVVLRAAGKAANRSNFDVTAYLQHYEKEFTS